MEKNKLEMKLNWKRIKGIPVYLFMLYFLFVISIYLSGDLTHNLHKPSTYGIAVLWLALTLISLLEINIIRRFLKKHAKWINSVVLLLAPIVSFLVVETMVSNFNLDMFKSYSLYNLIWYVIIYYLVFALLRNSKYTIIISNLAIYIASLVNYFVYLFRGNPVLPSDLLAWQTGMSVASNYDISFTEGFLISTFIMFSLFVLGYKLEQTEKKPSVLNRLIVIGSYVVFSVVVFNAFFETDLIKSKIKVLDFFAPKYTYCSYGTVFGFVANVQAMETQAPEGYSAEKVKDILDNVKVADNETADTEDKPNIIAIMSEAFSDLSMIGDFKTNMDYLPFIRSLQDNTIKGTMYTSVFGGGTSDTEYEFLTGNSMAVMPQNSVPYQQFITESTDSLAATLKNQGYYNIAIHPYEPSGYKRDLVYPLLGFDEFLSMKDFVNPTLIRSFISDKDSFQKIIEQYENKGKDNPLFIFNVTMQNHGGYSDAQLFDDENTVRLTDYQGYSSAEQYLSLLRESDKAFQTLIDYFTKQEEHTIILLFGDHQPVAYSQLHDLLSDQSNLTDTKALACKYKVPFILWANYDIVQDDIDQISANYLSSYLLKTAGLPGTAYNQFLMKMYEKIPVINGLFYIDKDNIIHNYSETTAYTDLINQYKYIGYNDALDKKDKWEEFYHLK
ncbi:MAG: LTA synthase family protein [Herbinix sp.]|nr:LTA synthase family protein [Herbinix sp.]